MVTQQINENFTGHQVFSFTSPGVYLSTIVSRRSGGSTGTSRSKRARCTTLTRESSVTLRGRGGRELDELKWKCKTGQRKCLSDCGSLIYKVDDIPQREVGLFLGGLFVFSQCKLKISHAICTANQHPLSISLLAILLALTSLCLLDEPAG